MKLSTLITLFATLIGLAILGYDTYWYLITWRDPSQFIAFACVGLGIILLANILNIFYQRISKMQKTIDYFEDNLLDRYPELIKEAIK
jgi:predicted alpha-1,6-mannanase (GH76 family)